MPNPLSEKVMAAIQTAIQATLEKEANRGPLVGTGHVKWPPDELRVNKAGNPADVDMLVMTVNLNAIEK